MSMMQSWKTLLVAPGLATAALAAMPGEDGEEKKPDFPPFAKVSKDFEKVVSTLDGEKSLYTLWTREKDGQMLAELPAGYASQKHYIALTVPTGERFAGLQMNEMYVYWKRFDKRMALIAPNIDTRSTGDQESKDSVASTHAERVVLDVPIVCMGPSNQPVIDLDELLVGNAGNFYRGARGLNARLATVAKAKAFPQNVEVAFEVPDDSGELKTFHYSISRIPESSSYEPRIADERVGYFVTSFKDLGKFNRNEVWDRRINRWHLEKADASLRLSPPKNPIVFYLEHTVPVRYRRYVKDGVLAWNKAFEKVGISDAVVVHYQDKSTGAHMEKDPEDVRYNFIRWLSNDIGTAIGPSRAHPLTGQILDADIILTDGWIRAFWYQANEFLPEVAMEGFSQETLEWLERHPDWDPRIRLAAPEQRARLLRERRERAARGGLDYGRAFGDGAVLVHEELQALADQVDPHSMLCLASSAKAHNMAMMGLTMEVFGLLAPDEEGEEGEESDVQEIDGIPEWFIGPALADLVSHEVGHTLGLRHNFKASSIYTLQEMNSEGFVGKVPIAGSVMDYLPLNAVIEDGKLKGDHSMIGIGPYDEWAIEYGYTFGDPKKVLERVAEPELAYLTDEDTVGPDPHARRYDLTKDPLDYAENAMVLVREARERILDEFVQDGDSWAKARRGYEITLGSQRSAIGIMANWLGGVHVNRDRKGDPNGRKPLKVVSAEEQRAALKFVLENAFFDDVYGLTPELLASMTVDKWADGGNWSAAYTDPTWPIHDRIAGMQATALTQLMNPTTLRRIYDNELYLEASDDALTLPEMMQTVTGAVWQEVGYEPQGGSHVREASSTRPATLSARRPLISSLRRNLQQEHLDRLIDLTLDGSSGPANKSITLLARMTLDTLGQAIEGVLTKDLDPYTRSHLLDARTRITKALDASYSLDGGAGGGAGGPIIIRFGEESEH